MDLPEEKKTGITSEESADNITEGEMLDSAAEAASGGWMWGIATPAVRQGPSQQQDTPRTKK